MKKLICAVLICALVAALCGCSITFTSKNATTQPTTATAEQFPTDAEGNPLTPSDAKISPEQAQEIVRLDMGIEKEQMLSPFVHIGEYEGQSCYSVQFATLDYDYEYVVSAVTGEILYKAGGPATTQEGNS